MSIGIRDMTITEARKVGEAMDSYLPPTNPAVLARATYMLYLSHDTNDRRLYVKVVEWLAYLVASNG